MGRQGAGALGSFGRKSLKMPVSDPGGDAEQEVGCLCLGLRRKVRSV